MDEEIKEQFDLAHKRIDDNKTLVKTIVSSTSAMFAVIAIILGFNYNSEKNEIKNFKKELKEQVDTFLGNQKEGANIKLYSENELPLDNQIIKVAVEKAAPANQKDFPGRIRIPFILRNEGKGASGEVTIKAYTKEGIQMLSRASFEQDYAYEAYWQGTQRTAIPNLPPLGYSHPYPFTLFIQNPESVKLGIHKVKVKIYYGSGKVTVSEFKIEVEENRTI